MRTNFPVSTPNINNLHCIFFNGWPSVHFSEHCFKELVKRLVVFHRVPRAAFDGSLGDLKSSALDEVKEYTKTRGACSFIYYYSILKNKEF